MPIWVYGRDKVSGRPCDPLFVESEDEQKARREAQQRGMEVEEVEVVDLQHREDLPPARRKGRQYEFSVEENQRFAKLIRWMSVYGAITAILACLIVLANLDGAFSARGTYQVLALAKLLGAVFGLLGVWWIFRAARAFQRVVDTPGKDIDHLLIGIDALASLFKLLVILFAIGLAIVLLALVVLALVH